MQDDTYQAIWEIERDDGVETSGVINSTDPLGMREWTERIERAVAALGLPAGSYPLKVRIGPMYENKWTVMVRCEASIVPF
jgi:hypothetical protein